MIENPKVGDKVLFKRKFSSSCNLFRKYTILKIDNDEIYGKMISLSDNGITVQDNINLLPDNPQSRLELLLRGEEILEE